MPGWTNIGLVSAALTRLGHKPIFSMDDTTDQGKVVIANYEIVYKACLSLHDWTFALFVESIDADGATAAPYDEVADYEFSPPSQMIRSIGRLDGTQIYPAADKIYADDNPLILLYVKRVAESKLSDTFADAFATELARRCCYAITQDGAKEDRLTDQAKDLWHKARMDDMRKVIPPSVEAALRANANRDTLSRDGNSAFFGG